MSRRDATAAKATVEHLRRLAGSNGGRIPTAMVAAAAASLGIGTSTLWRYLKDGVPEPRCLESPLDDVHLEAIARCNGELKAAQALLSETGEYTKSYRQFVRDFNALPPVIRDGLRRGVAAGIQSGLFLHSQAEQRLDRVLFDHTEADVRLRRVHAGKEETYRPWVTLLIDSATRLILAALVTEGDGLRGDPNTESLVALLALAIRGHHAADGTFVGGLPRMIQCDNAKAHLAEAMLSGYVSLGIAVHLIKPGSPWEDGKVERLMRTFTTEFLAHLPGFTGALPDRYSHEPWTPGDCLTGEEFDARLLEWVDSYNYERVHGSLGSTPFQAWCEDPTPIDRVDDGLIRSCFLAHSRPVSVSKNGVRFDKVDYVAPELKNLRGTKVTLRYLPHDRSFVDVYADGQFLCTAKPHSRLTNDERISIVRARGRDARKVERIVKTSRKRRVEAELHGNPIQAPERDPRLPADTKLADDDEDFLSFVEGVSSDSARENEDER